MHPDTIAASGGRRMGDGLAPGLDRSTTFDGEPGRASAYGRDGGPTLRQLEDALGALEAAEALVFASGLTAWTALCQALLRPGDVLAIPTRCYYGIEIHARTLLEPWGVTVRRVDAQDPAALRAGAAGAHVVLVETPANPQLRLVDIAAAAEACASDGALLVVDNTVGTPVLQRPLDLGAHIAMQSATKYLGGHSDLLAGVLAARDGDLLARIRRVRTITGGALAPDPAWLLQRGLRTLPLRVARQSASAALIARRLSAVPEVVAVHFPALDDHPDAALARRQMPDGCGGLLAFELADGATADRVVAGLRLIRAATSLGGVESLIERRARIEPEGRVAPGLLRLSVGLEHPDDLLADLLGAIAAATR